MGDPSRLWVSHMLHQTWDLHSPLRAKQSFQSNKTHRKLCEVLTTYQSLYYSKNFEKKSLNFIWATGPPPKKR